MNTELLNKIEKEYLKTDLPAVAVGDTVEVTTIIREGDKQRTQKFKGLVISMNGSGIRKTFTVRKISFGIGVEKIFPIHSPNVKEITIIKTGKVRRSKIYYMRDRVGRSAMKVKAGRPMVEEEGVEVTDIESVTEAEVAAIEEAK